MWAALLLALAASPPAGDAGAAAEFVRTVEIEADRPERLAPFVGLVPGRPLDREAVRRAVELIYATGLYEDVRVELVREPGQEGVTVVFRPLPAPLFVAVRIVGDRVLSPGSVQRIARLRPGEPLWPSRLERAARDVALALVRHGNLEALVEPRAVRVPGGADAEFRIRAGPRVRVGGTRVEGAAGVPSLDDLVRPLPGEIYRKERADAACEAMRRRLSDWGFWRAEVELRETYDPTQGRMSLVFKVDPGPRVHLELRGASMPAGLVSTVRNLLRDGGASSDALEAGAEKIESYLRTRGHRDARVNAEIEPREPGEAVVYDIDAGPAAVAVSVDIRGASRDLLAGLRTRPGGPIQDSILDEDAARLQARLEERGHYEARVEPDVPDGGGPLPVVFFARPGPRALVKSVEVVGPPRPLSSDEHGPQELALRPGLPYRLGDLARSRETLLEAWQRAGYLDVTVRSDVDLVPAGEQPAGASGVEQEARVKLIVEPGPRTIVEHVVLAGLRETRPVTVEREMELRPGEPFSFERLLESQRRLSGLGIFERVSISELNPERERRRDVVVAVQEAPRTTVSYGVGYSEQDRLRGSIEVTRRNLSGLGRTLTAFARASTRGSRALLNLREPWLFGRQLDSFLTGFWEQEDRTSFSYNRKGGLSQAGRSVNPHTSVILRYLYQNTNVYNIQVPIDEIDRQYRTYTVSGPAATVVFDTRDDPLEPRRGVFLAADTQLSFAALGGVSYVRSFFQATNIQRLSPATAIVVSGRLGLAATFRDEPPLIPLPERFFAGGETGPRGFPVDGVGPQVLGTDGQLYPTGGNALLLGDVELRYNLTRSFQLASFLDNGNVFLEVRDIRLSNLRWSAGLGVRYRTPIGPIRLDWGYVLDRRPGEAPSHFNLTIGYAF
jgi:outer membrane protein insertion porin family